MERDEGQRIKKLKQNEFEFGLRPNYTKIGEYINEYYADRKYAQNALAGYGQIDLIRTGAFVNSMFVVQRGIGFIFDANNNKAGKLINTYGSDIMGLNQNTFNKHQKEFILPQLRKFIKTKLGQ